MPPTPKPPFPGVRTRSGCPASPVNLFHFIRPFYSTPAPTGSAAWPAARPASSLVRQPHAPVPSPTLLPGVPPLEGRGPRPPLASPPPCLPVMRAASAPVSARSTLSSFFVGAGVRAWEAPVRGGNPGRGRGPCPTCADAARAPSSSPLGPRRGGCLGQGLKSSPQGPPSQPLPPFSTPT